MRTGSAGLCGAGAGLRPCGRAGAGRLAGALPVDRPEARAVAGAPVRPPEEDVRVAMVLKLAGSADESGLRGTRVGGDVGGAWHGGVMATSSRPAVSVDRAQVLRYRVHAQQLDRRPRSDRAVDAAAVLDLGVQDTGPDGALWALAIRGLPVEAGRWPHELALAWTLRGAPHAYRRTELRTVERAVRPFSEADAAKRIMSAAGPLKKAGIGRADALSVAATAMRDVVTQPLEKGALSTRMTAVLDDPYLRWCEPCQATHPYEMVFRLAALHAGLELEPGTSPPVIRRIPRWPAAQVGDLTAPEPGGPSDVLRALLHLLGPMTPGQAAEFLDAPARDIRERWPHDAVDVLVDGAPASLLAGDVAALERAAEPPGGAPVVRLLGPYDLFLQGRDREVIVPDARRRPELWRTLGRPGAVLAGGEIVGTWRPRARGQVLGLELDEWVPWDATLRANVEGEHERLAEFRGLRAT